MRCSKRLRRFIAVFGSAAVLFTQTVMAAHACVARTLADEPAAMAAPMPSHEGTPCAAMESEHVNHCQQHCDSAQQSVDNSHPVSVMPALVEIGTVRIANPYVLPAANEAYQHALLSRSTAPPLSVQNCCFRI